MMETYQSVKKMNKIQFTVQSLSKEIIALLLLLMLFMPTSLLLLVKCFPHLACLLIMIFFNHTDQNKVGKGSFTLHVVTHAVNRLTVALNVPSLT